MMLSIFKEWQKRKRIQKKKSQVLANPIGFSVLNYLKEVLDDKNTYVGKHLTSEIKSDLIDDVMNRVTRIIFLSNNQILDNRKYLYDWTLRMASFGVLIIPEETAFDHTQLRGKPGISSELRNHLVNLTKKNNFLNETLYDANFSSSPDEEKIFEVYLFHYSVSQVHVQAANIIRCLLDDYHDDEKRDWFNKFVEIGFAWYESIYRMEIGLPDLLGEQTNLGELANLKYARFFDIILSGERDPRYVWENAFLK